MQPESLIKLAEYGGTGISIVLILTLAYLVKLIIPQFVNIVAEMRRSIEANTKITNELADYIHIKNGDMARAVTKLCKEVDKISRKN